jgi:ABC-2 type transport system ATP-binding protein
MSIEVKNVSKLYDTQKALDDVSFSIGTGEIVGFLGPNGAGKSTMMKIITGYIPQTSGTVLINGQDTDTHSLEIRKTIGYLPENNPLYHDMYVREYLEFVAGIYKLNNKRLKVEKIIDQTGLGLEKHKKIAALSKGYKQRVGLAQALIHDPKVLILDEPTSGLDPNQIIEIRNLILEIGREKTIMLSTHIMQEVDAICHKIIIINQGKIVADDSTRGIHTKVESKESAVVVEFDKAISTSAFDAIKAITNIQSLDGNRWLISCQADVDIRADLFRMAIEKNLILLTLFRKEKTMEEVFQELTQKKNKA